MPMLPILFSLVAAAAPAAKPAAPAANDAAALFPQLKMLRLPNEGVRIFYPPARATPVTVQAAYLKSYEEAGVSAEQPLRVDLGHGVPPATLTCDAGPHADPSCRLLTDAENPGSTVFESSGIDFVLLDDAEIFVFGRSDALYDHRRLFRFDGKRYAEVPQAFRWVGIDGVAHAAIALTHARGGDAGRPLTTVPAGARVTVLLNAASGDDDDGQNADYLVRTREGLVGWARLPTAADGRTAIEGLYFGSDGNANASK